MHSRLLLITCALGSLALGAPVTNAAPPLYADQYSSADTLPIGPFIYGLAYIDPRDMAPEPLSCQALGGTYYARNNFPPGCGVPYNTCIKLVTQLGPHVFVVRRSVHMGNGFTVAMCLPRGQQHAAVDNDQHMTVAGGGTRTTTTQ